MIRGKEPPGRGRPGFSPALKREGFCSLSWWRPQPNWDCSGGNQFPLLPFATGNSVGGGAAGGPSLSLSVAERHPTQRCRPTFLLMSALLPEEHPQEKNCCAKPLPGTQLGLQQAPVTPVRSSPVSCYLPDHLPRCAQQASRVSQRLPESPGSTCDHCHKNRVS